MKSCIGKAFLLSMSPFNMVFNLTIPNADDESFSYIMTPLSIGGFLGSVSIYMYIIGSKYASLLLLIAFAVMCACFALIMILKEEFKKLQILISTLSFIASIFWTWMIMNHTIDIIKLLADVSGVDHFVMGVFLIGVGNCVPDMFANRSLVDLGLSKMAISGSISSPLFNTSIGLSLTFITALLTKYLHKQ